MSYPFDDARELVARWESRLVTEQENAIASAAEMERIIEYIHALEKENSGLVGFAWIHGMIPSQDSDTEGEDANGQ